MADDNYGTYNMFAKITVISLNNRIMVLLATALLLAWGIFVARDMPIDLMPDTRPPSVIITAEAGALTSEEVEQLITVPIEQALAGVPGIVSMRSMTNASVAYFQLIFSWGTDALRARQMVGERLLLVREKLPDGVVPILAPMGTATGLIMTIAVTGGDNPMALREYVDWVLRPRLMAVEGVSQIFVIGGEVRTLQFTPNMEMMHFYGITLADLERALAQFGSNTSGGFSDVFGTNYAIRNIGRTYSLTDMRDVVVAYRDGAAVMLQQVGDTRYAPAFTQGNSAFNGQPSVNVSVIKHPHANTVQLSDRIKAVVLEMQNSAPQGVNIGEVSYRQADMIREAVANLGEVLRDAVVIVALVLLAFLCAVRPTLISLTAIPVSLVICLIVFHISGTTINTMTLGGIAIGIGALVDDAVVNVENILRRLIENREKECPEHTLTVLARASNEVRSGILYATAIILIVFIPLLTLPGQQGRMFQPLAVAFVISIAASLIVSITITPVLSFYAFPNMKSLSKSHGGALVRSLRSKNDGLLLQALDRPKLVLGVAGAAVAISAASILFMPRAFLPQFNEGNVYVTMLLPPDVSMAESYKIGNLAAQFLRNLPEVKSISQRTGRYDGDSDVDPVSSNEFQLRIVLDNQRSLSQLMTEIRRQMAVFPGEVNVTQFLISRLQSQDNMVRGDLVLKVFGPDLRTIRLIAERFKKKFQNIPGLVDIEVEQQTFSPQYRFKIDYERAKLFGIPPAEVTGAMGTLANGKVVSQVIEGRRRFDVVIKLSEKDRGPESLAQIRVDTPSGPVPLSSLAAVTASTGPSRILRENGERRIALMANVKAGADLTSIVSTIREAVLTMPMPDGYRVVFGGDFEQGEEARTKLALLAPLSLLLMFMLLYQKFRSPVLCAIIMGNIPLALVGSVAALWIMGLNLDLAAMIGFIAVGGVAVRNSLLKISHYINLHLHEGMPLGRELILRGSAERLMPVLMTALAAGLALAPLLFVSDRAGAEILHPVAVTVFGGLISSTLLDSFTTPILFHVVGERAVRKSISNNGRMKEEIF